MKDYNVVIYKWNENCYYNQISMIRYWYNEIP